jgi:hypothetical protein
MHLYKIILSRIIFLINIFSHKLLQWHKSVQVNLNQFENNVIDINTHVNIHLVRNIFYIKGVNFTMISRNTEIKIFWDHLNTCCSKIDILKNIYSHNVIYLVYIFYNVIYLVYIFYNVIYLVSIFYNVIYLVIF